MAPAMITVASAMMPSAIWIRPSRPRVAERAGDRARWCGAPRPDIERQLAAQKAVGIEPPEHQVGVGHGRARCRRCHSRRGRASSPRSAGRHARRFCGSSQAIEPPPEPDLHDVDDRRLDREALHVAAGVVDRLDREAAVLDQRAFRRGAAHVERDDVLEAERFRIGAGPDAAADRTRLDERRPAAGRCARRDISPPFEPIM